MANEVNVKVRIMNSNKVARQGLTVSLLNSNNEDPFLLGTGSTVASTSTDSGGWALFTSVTAGNYAISVANSGNTTMVGRYTVQNSYVVDPSNVFESRFAVRSGENIQGVSAGIISRSASPIGGMDSSYAYGRNPTAPMGNITGTQLKQSYLTSGTTTYYQNGVAGTIFSSSDTLKGKWTGNSYYHDNQNTTFTQKIDIVVG